MQHAQLGFALLYRVSACRNWQFCCLWAWLWAHCQPLMSCSSSYDVIVYAGGQKSKGSMLIGFKLSPSLPRPHSKHVHVRECVCVCGILYDFVVRVLVSSRILNMNFLFAFQREQKKFLCFAFVFSSRFFFCFLFFGFISFHFSSVLTAAISSELQSRHTN